MLPGIVPAGVVCGEERAFVNVQGLCGQDVITYPKVYTVKLEYSVENYTMPVPIYTYRMAFWGAVVAILTTV